MDMYMEMYGHTNDRLRVLASYLGHVRGLFISLRINDAGRHSHYCGLTITSYYCRLCVLASYLGQVCGHVHGNLYGYECEHVYENGQCV